MPRRYLVFEGCGKRMEVHIRMSPLYSRQKSDLALKELIQLAIDYSSSGLLPPVGRLSQNRGEHLQRSDSDM